MGDCHLSRREFVQTTPLAAGVAAGLSAFGPDLRAAEAKANAADVAKTRSYNPNMQYRRLGKTGAWVSAVCMGGHWKRIDKAIAATKNVSGYEQPGATDRDKFDANRYEVVSRCIEQGINLIDACTGGEVMAYAKALKGRRDKMFLNFSWYEKEMRNKDYRTAGKLVQTLEDGLKQAGLEYVDLWRITCHEKGSLHPDSETEQMVKALETAKRQGKCRFTGLSSHDRPWLKKLIETYPDQIQVIVSPYTADSKELPQDSLFDAVRKHDVGFLGIKPFASNSLFKGDSSLASPTAKEDDERARLAIRYILCNPAVTAPIPGLINPHQVDNVVAAIKERRQLDQTEKAHLDQAATEMWAKLPEDYQWLKDWQYV